LRFEVPEHGDAPATIVYRDGAINTKTHGKYFIEDHFGLVRGQPMATSEVLQVMKQIEAILIDHYGEQRLFRWMMEPTVIGVHISKEDYDKRIFRDAEFTEKMDVQDLLLRIQRYRTKHKTEQAEAGNPGGS